MNKHNERAELIDSISVLADTLHLQPIGNDELVVLLRRAAAMLEAQPAEQASRREVAKFFLPPARHDGIAENTVGTYQVRVTGLTIRQIKDIFEDKFLGSMMWSNGVAYPTDGVEIRFVKDQPDTTQPAQPALEWVGLTEDDREVIRLNVGQDYCPYTAEATESKLREKNAGLPAAVPSEHIQEVNDSLWAELDEIKEKTGYNAYREANRGLIHWTLTGYLIDLKHRAETPAAVPDENRCIRELREYAAKNPGTYIFPRWDGSRVTKYLAAEPKPQ